jgi:hypothetical protein
MLFIILQIANIHHKSFQVIQSQEPGNFVINSIEEVISFTEEQLNKICFLKASQYSLYIMEDCKKTESKLFTMEKILAELSKCQKDWVLLGPIFMGPETARYMPDASRKFASVEISWKNINKSISVDPSLNGLLEREGLAETLIKIHSQFEVLHKSLSTFLESRRNNFPRLYLLNDDELTLLYTEAKVPFFEFFDFLRPFTLLLYHYRILEIFNVI